MSQYLPGIAAHLCAAVYVELIVVFNPCPICCVPFVSALPVLLLTEMTAFPVLLVAFCRVEFTPETMLVKPFCRLCSVDGV